MINLYKKTGDLSSKKVEKRLKKYQLPYEIVIAKEIIPEIIKKMLFLTENEFHDLLSSKKES